MPARVPGNAAIACLALLFACVQVDPGPNQNAHMASATALAHGTPRIDRYHWWSRDVAYVDGHYYAAKAPGLALFSVPWYVALDRTGALVPGPPPSVRWPEAEREAMPRTAPWRFALWGATLPFFLLLLLVRRVADELVPGSGLATAFTLGAGSIVGVFGVIYFDHELSALLGFAAFTLLVRDRARRCFSAGVVAALAVTAELPLALVALVLLVYARRRAAFGGGLALGALPLLAFNAWATGSPFSTTYADAVKEPGRSGHDVLGANASGFFGLGRPSPHALVELLLSAKGLLILTPVWALAAAGLRWLPRAEARVAAAVTALFLAYDASYYLPFGGFNGGPRFLVPMLPFLALGLGAAWRRWPGPTLALAAASIVVTTVSLLANPMIVSEDAGTMFHRLWSHGDRNGPVSGTVLGIPLLVLAGAVLALAALVLARRVSAREVALGAAALVAWRIAYVGGAILVHQRHGWGVAALLASVAALALWSLVTRREQLALPAVLLAPLVWPDYAAHVPIALATISASLLATAVLATWRGGAPRAAS